MKKTLLLAFAAASFTLVGCSDDTAVDADTVVVEPAPAVTAPADDMMMDTTGTMTMDPMNTAPATDPMAPADTLGM